MRKMNAVRLVLLAWKRGAIGGFRMSRRDLVVIGGGVGGLVVTSVAAQLGLNVTLVECGAWAATACTRVVCRARP